MEEKNNKLFKYILIVSGICILIVLGVGLGLKYKSYYEVVKKPYAQVGDKIVSKLEYNYYYVAYQHFYISSYSALFDYMGVDKDKPLEEQQYDEGRTFGEFFDESACSRIIEMYVLNKDGKEKGLEFDTESKYGSYIRDVQSACNASHVSVNKYFENFYGEYATEKRIRPFIIDGYYANLYTDYLIEELGSEEAAYDYIMQLREGYEVTFK